MDSTAKNLDQSTPSGRDEKLSIFGYTNYRTYLNDHYLQKKSGRGFSFRAFSKAAGFSSPNFLKLVIDGKRNISLVAINKIVTALKLQGTSAQYFRILVQMNQAATDAEKQVFFDQLKTLTPHAHKRQLNIEAVEYLSHWIYPALREMVTLPDFSEDPHWIARRFTCPVATNEITSALNFLIKNDFLTRNAEGKLIAKDNIVISSDEVRSLAIRNYHRQMLQQSEKVLELLPLEEREFGALTVTLPEDVLGELKQKLKNFRSEIHTWALSMASEKTADSVIQLNIQMYPHSRSLGRGQK
jgi:uncharacterized protein (TIGR02147 family)